MATRRAATSRLLLGRGKRCAKASPPRGWPRPRHVDVLPGAEPSCPRASSSGWSARTARTRACQCRSSSTYPFATVARPCVQRRSSRPGVLSRSKETTAARMFASVAVGEPESPASDEMRASVCNRNTCPLRRGGGRPRTASASWDWTVRHLLLAVGGRAKPVTLGVGVVKDDVELKAPGGRVALEGREAHVDLLSRCAPGVLRRRRKSSSLRL